MTVNSFAKELDLDILCMPSPDKTIDGAYIGDLLSWVMGNADPGNVWITIMSNVNIVAVATLVDTSCIILAENVKPDNDVIKLANTKGVNIFTTSLSAYETAVRIASLKL